jgi:hypothetical protein
MGSDQPQKHTERHEKNTRLPSMQAFFVVGVVVDS